jgi:hypothetical protein
MPGPFTSYAPPGVYTQTLVETQIASLPANLRVTALIGTGQEELTVEDFELFRGSSPFGDMFVPDEDVSNQIVNGNETTFQVTHYPMVTGDGTNTTTDSPADVKVLVNNEEVTANVVDGATGQVTLIIAPGIGATVKVSYYFHRTDTQITDEDISSQADGSTVTFKVANVPITDGSGSGLPTTDTSTVTLKINDVDTTVDVVDGQNGLVTINIPVVEVDDAITTGSVNTGAATTGAGTVTANNDPIVTSSGVITNAAGDVSVSITVGASTQVRDAVAVTGETGVVEIPFFVNQVLNEDVSAQFTGVELGFTTANPNIVNTTNGQLTTVVSDVSVDIAPAFGTGPSNPAAVTITPSTGLVLLNPPTISDNFPIPGVSVDGTSASLGAGFIVSRFEIVNSSGLVTTNVVDATVIVTPGPQVVNEIEAVAYNPVLTSLTGSSGAIDLDVPSIRIEVTEPITDLGITVDGLIANLNGTTATYNKPVAVSSTGAVASADADISLNVTPGTTNGVLAGTPAPATGTVTGVDFDLASLSLVINDNRTFTATGGETSFDISSGFPNYDIVNATGLSAVDADITVTHTRGVTVTALTATTHFTLVFSTGVVTLTGAFLTLISNIQAGDVVSITYKRLPNTNLGDTFEVVYDRLPNTAYSDTVEVDYLRLPNTGYGDVVEVTYNYGTVATIGVDDVVLTYNHRDLPDSNDGDVVEVSYFFNTFRNTFDYLPKSGVTSITRVGDAQGRANYFEPTDYTVIDDRIHWGSVADVQDGIVSTGSEPLSGKFSATTLVDDKIYLEQAIGTVNGTNKEFTVNNSPVDGSGQSIETEDTALIRVYVGTNATTAFSGGAVDVAKIVGAQKKITLKDAPAIGELVFVTYYASRLTDDLYTFTVTNTATDSYTISSQLLGSLSTAQAFVPAGSTFTTYLRPVLTTPGASTTGDIYAKFISSTEIEFYDNDPNTTGVLIGTSRQGQTFITPAGTNGPEGVWISIGNSSEFSAGGFLSFQFNLNQTLRIRVQQGGTFTATFNQTKFDRYQVPGLVYVVTDTNDVDNGDTATVQTYNKSGSEPLISAPYYVTFKYAKTDYNARLYTNIDDVVRNFGPISTQNRLSLAASLIFQNGAPGVIVKQVVKATGSDEAAAASYVAALSDLEFPVGGINPGIIVPLTADTSVQTATQKHCEVQSSIRYHQERICILGTSIGTTKEQVKAMAEGFFSNRVWLVYPDIAIISLVDSLGREIEQVVDGPIIAAALAGVNTSTAYDVATPMTNKNVAGFVRLGRRFTNVQMDNMAGSGVLLLAERFPNVYVRDGLTTDMTDIFSQQTQIVTIADYVQQTARTSLNAFIGLKFTAGRENEVADKLNSALNILKGLGLIFGFTYPKVNRGSSPDTLFVEVKYQPIFGLSYIVVTFKLTA